MSAIVDAVVGRLKSMMFPIMHGRIEDDINSMVGIQAAPIAMSKLERDMLVERIVTRYKEALMKENEPVGVIAAQTIAENQVQSSLSSHHHAGLRRGAVGFDRIEQLTSLSNTGLCKLVPSPIQGDGVLAPMPKDMVYELSNKMISITAKNILSSYEILEEDHPSWYKLYMPINNIIPVNLTKRWIRIHFNKDLMYRYRITLNAIAASMTQRLAKNGVVLHSPIMLGSYIDVHIHTHTTDTARFRSLASLLACKVGGIHSVSTAYTLYENLLERIGVSQVGDGIYHISSGSSMIVPDFAWMYMLKAMIPDAEFIEGYDGRRFSSSLTLDQVRKNILDVPLKYADVAHQEVHDEENDTYTIEFDQSIIDEYPYLEYADLSPMTFTSREEMDNFLLDIMVDRHLFWYIEAICPNIEIIFMLPSIDSTRSYTTSPADCHRTLGYLAMRQMVYEEIRNNIKVNDVWLKILINNMTAYKSPVALERYSIRHDRTEWMTFTTFEEVLTWITRAAFVGEVDTLNSISASTIVGQPMKIGRGGTRLNQQNKFESLLKNDTAESVRRQQRESSTNRQSRADTAEATTTN